MKVKITTPNQMVVSFTRREVSIIKGCLNEACSGLLMDRFIPAHKELSEMLDEVRVINEAKDFYRLKPVQA